MEPTVTAGIDARSRRWGWWIALAGVVVGLMTRVAAFGLTVQAKPTDWMQTAFAASSVVVLVGLVIVLRADRSAMARGLTEAATLTSGALALLMWVGLVKPYVTRAALAPSQRMSAEVSLLLDLALLVLLVCLFSHRPSRTKRSMTLALGVVCHLATDIGLVCMTAQRGEITAPRLALALAFYAWSAAVIVRNRHRISGEAPVSHHKASDSFAFDPLVGVVLVNSVTVVLAGLHEDRVGALTVAAAALVLTAVAARAQWKTHARSEADLHALDAERRELRQAHEALTVAHATTADALATASHLLEAMTTRVAGPLNGVLEAADRLRDHELDKSADVLLGVMNDVLGVSQAATMAPELNENNCSLRSVIDTALRPYADAAAAKSLSFDVAVDDDVVEMVHGDGDRLAELLGLFADNAVTYTKRGGISVSVNHVEMRDGEYVLYFAFNDTGVGLSAYDCYRAFEPDVRADPHHRRYRGKPRGLNNARALVEKFGGLYGVESELGRGASFWFTVALAAAKPAEPEAELVPESIEIAPYSEPVAEVIEPAPEPEPEPEPDPEPEMVYEPEPEPEPEPEVLPEPIPEPAVVMEPEERAGLLLFAEDDPLCRRITVAALRRAGYHVDTVTNGVDAVNAVADRAYDVVLMDCQLPIMTGLEATAAIRAHDGESARIPVIAVSAFTTEQDKVNAIDAGMDAFVRKPLDIEELLAVLDRFVIQDAMA